MNNKWVHQCYEIQNQYTKPVMFTLVNRKTYKIKEYSLLTKLHWIYNNKYINNIKMMFWNKFSTKDERCL